MANVPATLPKYMKYKRKFYQAENYSPKKPGTSNSYGVGDTRAVLNKTDHSQQTEYRSAEEDRSCPPKKRRLSSRQTIAKASDENNTATASFLQTLGGQQTTQEICVALLNMAFWRPDTDVNDAGQIMDMGRDLRQGGKTTQEAGFVEARRSTVIDGVTDGKLNEFHSDPVAHTIRSSSDAGVRDQLEPSNDIITSSYRVIHTDLDPSYGSASSQVGCVQDQRDVSTFCCSSTDSTLEEASDSQLKDRTSGSCAAGDSSSHCEIAEDQTKTSTRISSPTQRAARACSPIGRSPASGMAPTNSYGSQTPHSPPVHCGSDRKALSLFPKLARDKQLWEIVEILARRHKEDYFVGWTAEEILDLPPDQRPNVFPMTVEVRKAYVSKSVMTENKKLAFSWYSDATWGVEFKTKLRDGTFRTLSDAKRHALQLWRKYCPGYDETRAVRMRDSDGNIVMKRTRLKSGSEFEYRQSLRKAKLNTIVDQIWSKRAVISKMLAADHAVTNVIMEIKRERPEYTPPGDKFEQLADVIAYKLKKELLSTERR